MAKNQSVQTVCIHNVRHNDGIDCLKIFAMLMVVTLHMLNFGGILQNVRVFSVNYELSWAIEAMCYCAVNVYVMITGYVYAGREIRLSRFFMLWLTVFFYSVGVTWTLKLLGNPTGSLELASSFFPILRKQYWFFNCYAALFLFIPVLNLIVKNKQLLQYYLIISILLFSILPVLGLGNDLFALRSGYSVIWFFSLYLCGAYLKEYDIPFWLHKGNTIVIYFISCLLLLLSKNTIAIISKIVLGRQVGTSLFFNYTSPFVVINAFCLLVFFSKLKIHSDYIHNCVKTISPLTFGVYLLHENLAFRKAIMTDLLKDYLDSPVLYYFVHLLLSILAIFFIGLIIDYFRACLFKLLHLSVFCQKLENTVMNLIGNKEAKFS